MYTKGEWKAEWEYLGGYDCMSHAYDITCGEQSIAVLDCAYYKGIPQRFSSSEETEETTTTPEIRANAYLIASAPRMYEALKEALAYTKQNDRVHFKVQQAIIKAEGK